MLSNNAILCISLESVGRRASALLIKAVNLKLNLGTESQVRKYFKYIVNVTPQLSYFSYVLVRWAK